MTREQWCDRSEIKLACGVAVKIDTLNIESSYLGLILFDPIGFDVSAAYRELNEGKHNDFLQRLRGRNIEGSPIYQSNLQLDGVMPQFTCAARLRGDTTDSEAPWCWSEVTVVWQIEDLNTPIEKMIQDATKELDWKKTALNYYD